MATGRRYVRHAPERAPALGQIILKVAQLCNLDCTYCYVYNRGDESWKTRPRVIQDSVVAKLGERIAEHCSTYSLDSFTVELHGGEPLLLGKKRMQSLVSSLRSAAPDVHLHFTLQTNGLLLDREWVQLFAANEISFGISLDGPPEIADKYRILRKSRKGSTQAVIDNIAARRSESDEFDAWFGGCLCVVNPEMEGARVVDWFAACGIESFDFLLPDGNRVNPPDFWTGPQPYRDFLMSAFDRWWELGSEAPRIRKFELMMTGLLGGRVQLDALGGDLLLLCVVESDGSIGVSDVTRICGGDFATDVIDIFSHRLDARGGAYEVARIQTPCATCQSCEFLASCGGGYLPHRFDGQSFANPSIYCDALYALSERMAGVLERELPEEMWNRARPVVGTGTEAMK